MSDKLFEIEIFSHFSALNLTSNPSPSFLCHNFVGASSELRQSYLIEALFVRCVSLNCKEYDYQTQSTFNEADPPLLSIQ